MHVWLWTAKATNLGYSHAKLSDLVTDPARAIIAARFVAECLIPQVQTSNMA
jgi:hypothetical protein